MANPLNQLPEQLTQFIQSPEFTTRVLPVPAEGNNTGTGLPDTVADNPNPIAPVGAQAMPLTTQPLTGFEPGHRIEIGTFPPETTRMPHEERGTVPAGLVWGGALILALCFASRAHDNAPRTPVELPTSVFSMVLRFITAFLTGDTRSLLEMSGTASASLQSTIRDVLTALFTGAPEEALPPTPGF